MSYCRHLYCYYHLLLCISFVSLLYFELNLVHREPWFCSTLLELLCSEETSHLWVLVMSNLMCLQHLHLLFSLMQYKLTPVSPAFSAGTGKVPGMYRSAGRVVSDSPPVLLGADVGLLLRTELERSLCICWSALQRKQVVQGTYSNVTISPVSPWCLTICFFLL